MLQKIIYDLKDLRELKLSANKVRLDGKHSYKSLHGHVLSSLSI